VRVTALLVDVAAVAAAVAVAVAVAALICRVMIFCARSLTPAKKSPTSL
jgi:hypothetical protein